MGILQMSNKYGRDTLEEACGKAVDSGDVRYAKIKNLIENTTHSTSPEMTPLPRHMNLRDPSEFN
jgi:hypothetical protein